MKKILLCSIIALGLNAYAQQCKNPTDVEFMETLLFVKSNNVSKAQKNFDDFCFDLKRLKESDKVPFQFMAGSKEMLEVIDKKYKDYILMKAPGYELDLLTYVMIGEKIDQWRLKNKKNDKEDPAKTAKVQEVAKKHNLNLNYSASKEEREKMLEFVASKYHQLRGLMTDRFGVSALGYGVYFNEHKVVSGLLKGESFKKDLVFKNKNGLTPMHMAFANKDNRLELNDSLVSALERRQIMFLTYQGIKFEDFIEIMKENNTDLYDKLVKKFNLKPTVGFDATKKKLIKSDLETKLDVMAEWSLNYK